LSYSYTILARANIAEAPAAIGRWNNRFWKVFASKTDGEIWGQRWDFGIFWVWVLRIGWKEPARALGCETGFCSLGISIN